MPTIGRAASVGVLLAILMLAAPTSAWAKVSGGCTATAVATKSGSIDLASADSWHLKHADVVNGAGKSPAAQTFARVQVVTFGIGVSILDAKGSSQTGSTGDYKVADYDRFTRVLLVTGKSDSCDGSVLIVIDDVGPLATLAGILGALVGLLALLGLLASLFLAPGLSSRLVGAILGLLSGLGFAELLQQAEWLDPRSPAVLLLPGLGIVIGAVVPGLLHRGRVAAP